MNHGIVTTWDKLETVLSSKPPVLPRKPSRSASPRGPHNPNSLERDYRSKLESSRSRTRVLSQESGGEESTQQLELTSLKRPPSGRPLTAPMKGGHKQVKAPLPYFLDGVTEVDIQRIYKARCDDGQIPLIPDQLRRFYDFCARSIKDRKFTLAKASLGPNSAEMVAQVVRNNYNFAQLELRNNDLGDKGAVILAKALSKALNLVHIGLAGNDIGPEGANVLFRSLAGSHTVTSLDLSSSEGLHRNRITGKGAEALVPLLKGNQVLMHLNLAGTGLGQEGIELLAEGFEGNRTLLALEIGGNGLVGRAVEGLARVVVGSKLAKLGLAGNKLGLAGCEVLGRLLCGGYDGYCPLQHLDLSKNEIPQAGVSRIYSALCRNGGLKTLLLDNNPIGPAVCPELHSFLVENRSLNTLSLAYCELRSDGVAVFSEGLSKNHSLQTLNLSWNVLEDAGSVSIATGVGHNDSLKSLDLSSNRIHDKGGFALCEAIRTNRTLEMLQLQDNNIHDTAGQLFAEITRGNRTLVRLGLRYNPINQKYVNEINENISGNKDGQRRKMMPLLRTEIEKLQVKDGAFEEITILEHRKKAEEEELLQQLKGTEDRYEHYRAEEEKKFLALRQRLQAVVAEKDQKDEELVQLQADTMVRSRLRLKTDAGKGKSSTGTKESLT